MALITGWSTRHKASFAQLMDTEVCSNGYNPVSIINLRNATGPVAGITAPGAPTSGFSGTGLTGTYLYRVRWYDSLTGTMSLPGTSLSVSPVNQGVQLTQPAGAPSRATHWIIERTTDGGAIFYPLNRVYATPSGTALASTYTDTTTDTTLAFRDTINLTQGVPLPMSFLFANMGRIFGGGAARHYATCVVTNGNATVTSADGQFIADNVGKDFSVQSATSAKTYKVATFTNANSIDLSEVYAGPTTTAECYICGPRDYLNWSEALQAESWGAQQANGSLGNTFRIGDDGEPLMGGCGVGPNGVIVAKLSRIFQLSYVDRPNKDGDGRLTPNPVRRGIVSKDAIIYAGGHVYGIDWYGIWRMSPGGLPEPIDRPICYDWWRNCLNWTTMKNWFIEWQPVNRLLRFWVTFTGQTYPQNGFTLDMDSQKWVGTRNDQRGRTCVGQMPDTEGRLRSYFFTPPSTSPNVQAYAWHDDIGKSMGAPPSTSPTTCTITTVTLGVLFGISGAVFPTTGEGLKGVPVLHVRASDGSTQPGVVSANGGATLTLNGMVNPTPIVGDTLLVGYISARVLTGIIDCGMPDRKKCFQSLWLWVKGKTSCTPIKARVFYDGGVVANTPDTDHLTLNEDGVSQVTAFPDRICDPTTQQTRYEIKLNNQPKTNIQFEFLSDAAGAPWEISKMKLRYTLDKSREPRL